MDDQKSNLIFLKNRKRTVSQTYKAILSETNKEDRRINLVGDACNKSGNFAMVPNCIYEMGLTAQEREIWLYLNRLAPWEHPVVDQIHKTIGIRKSLVLAGLEKLCALKMIVVQGEGKSRRFHIPHPVFWAHDLPRTIYAVALDEEQPLDITNGVFSGAVKKRSVRNVPDGTKKNVPGGTKQRSGRNEKMTKNVPGGTKKFQQNLDAKGVEGPLNTSFQNLVKLSLNPTDVGQMDLPGDEGGKSVEPVEERKITLVELEGSMLSLYARYTQPKVISALVRTMLRKRSAREILSMVEEQRQKQEHLLEWSPDHTNIWLRKLEVWKQRD